MANIILYGEIRSGTSSGMVGTSSEQRETNYGNVQAAITAILQNFANYYTKTQTYTKDEVNSLVSAGIKMEVVQTLPTTDIDTHTIYLVPKSTPTTDNAKDEYVYVNNNWEKIGDTEIDLSGYVTISAMNTALAEKVSFPSNPVENAFYLLVNNTWTRVYFIASAISYTPATQYPSSVTDVMAALDFLGVAAIGNFSVEDVSNLTANSHISIDQDDNGLLPLDGYHYCLGSVSSLMFSNSMVAMKLGTTVTFTASSDFVVKLPYSYTDNGTTVNPAVPARMVGSEKLECLSGNQYVLTITTACGTDGNPMNLFNMQQLISPTATSNNIS